MKVVLFILLCVFFVSCSDQGSPLNPENEDTILSKDGTSNGKSKVEMVRIGFPINPVCGACNY